MRPGIRYEWDEEKREANLATHGLAFEDAWQVFESPGRWDLASARPDEPERRQVFAIAEVAGDVCQLAYVVRGNTVRCISYRRASKREREEYHEYVRSYRQQDE